MHLTIHLPYELNSQNYPKKLMKLKGKSPYPGKLGSQVGTGWVMAEEAI